MLNKRIKTVNRLIRRFFSVKSKYPLNEEYLKKLPVFDYGTSKDNYQRIFAWGNIQTGALGILYMKSNQMSHLQYIQSPKRISIGEKLEVATATTGFGFTVYAVNSDTSAKLYGTGINTDSQIGFHCKRKGHPLETIYYPMPINLPFKKPESSKVVKLSAGRAHLAVLTDEGLFLLGNNAYGQCARKIIDGEDYKMSNYIHHVEKIDGKSIINIECGQDHTLAVTDDGSVYSCGWGADGQTGLGHFNNCDSFTKVQGDIEGENIVKLACRSDFVLALNDKGEAFGWGNTEYGQITLDSGEQQLPTPTHIKMLTNLGKIDDVASGGSMCAVLTKSGQVYTWGYGILGIGPAVQQSATPQLIPETLFGTNAFQSDNKVIRIRCGLNYYAAITNFGNLYTWGKNKQCCLGLGHNKDQYFPFKVALGGTVRDVSCAIDHTIAICKPFV